jgi:hypothetical protein
VNEVTWPKFVRRYLVILIEILKSGNFNGLKPKECKRLIKCLQRDGGVLFGSTIIVVVESDVQVCWNFPESNQYACFFSKGKNTVFCHILLSFMDFFFGVEFCGL